VLDDDMHLNAMAKAADGKLFIAGKRAHFGARTTGGRIGSRSRLPTRARSLAFSGRRMAVCWRSGCAAGSSVPPIPARRGSPWIRAGRRHSWAGRCSRTARSCSSGKTERFW
jgi:hypothetical protein